MKGLIFWVFAIMMLTPAQGEENEQLEHLMESVEFEKEEEFLQSDTLDVKTLGCVKADECDVETTVELFSNNTIFVMTKHCLVTPLCNLARKLPIATLLYLTVAVITTWQITEASK